MAIESVPATWPQGGVGAGRLRVQRFLRYSSSMASDYKFCGSKLWRYLLSTCKILILIWKNTYFLQDALWPLKSIKNKLWTLFLINSLFLLIEMILFLSSLKKWQLPTSLFCSSWTALIAILYSKASTQKLCTVKRTIFLRFFKENSKLSYFMKTWPSNVKNRSWKSVLG